MKSLIVLCAFGDYFPSVSYYSQDCINQQITLAVDKNYFFSGCYFFGISNTNNGGAISYTSSGTSGGYFVIENCLFHDCFSSKRGGSIFIEETKSGSVVLNKVCGFQVNAQGATAVGNSGICSHIRTPDSVNHKYNFLSVSGSTSSMWGTISSWGGNQEINNLNSSNHKNILYYSAIYTYDGVCTIKWSTFVSNTCGNSVCVGFRYTTGINYAQYCNIIGNNSPSGYAVVYSGAASTYIQYCNFNQNQNRLFTLVTSGFLKVQNCWITHIGTVGLTPENSSDFMETHPISHYGTHVCLSNIGFIQSFSIKRVFCLVPIFFHILIN